MVVFDVYAKWMLAALECLGFVAFTRYDSKEEKQKRKNIINIQTFILYIFFLVRAHTTYKNRTALKFEEVKNENYENERADYLRVQSPRKQKRHSARQI